MVTKRGNILQFMTVGYISGITSRIAKYRTITNIKYRVAYAVKVKT